MTINTEGNILFKDKKTKFGLEKYIEKSYKLKKLKNKNFVTNKQTTNFKWLVYRNNSCRYDVFSTFYIFCIYDYMNEDIKEMGGILQNIHNLMTQIKNNPGQVVIKELWKYCIQHKIDIERTEINNINNIVESGFGINGTIVQSFSIFKNNKHFCISEERQEIYQICNNIKCFKPTLHSHLIIIDAKGLNLKNIEIYLYIL